MTEGILRHAGRTATISPDGWQSDAADLLTVLESVYPPESTEAGEGWIVAFHRAAEELGAEVVQGPEPDPWPGIGDHPAD